MPELAMNNTLCGSNMPLVVPPCAVWQFEWKYHPVHQYTRVVGLFAFEKF